MTEGTNTISGKIASERTGLGIPDLLVVVYDLDSGPPLTAGVAHSGSLEGFSGIWGELAGSGDRIGSVLTDEHGRFELEYDDDEYRRGDQEDRPDLVFVVMAPETTQELLDAPSEPSGDVTESPSDEPIGPLATPLEEQIVHISSVPRVEAGRREEFALYLTDEQIERAGIAVPDGTQAEFDPDEAAGEYLATVADDLDFRTQVKEGIVELEGRRERVNRQREYYEEIVDEVMSGFGRTGEWFASDLFDVMPDIMTMAKGLTGAYAPLGGTIVTPEIAEFFEDNMFCHGHTYAGHPVSVAAGLAAVETYQDENLIEHAREVGEFLGDRLAELGERHPSVGDTRGVGLFRGIELTKHPQKRVPFGEREDKISKGTTVVDEVAAAARDEGVYVANMINTLIIAPPIGIAEADIDVAVDALDSALEVSDDAMED